MKKIVLLSSFFLILTITIIRFIQLSNDHLECSQKIENRRNANGDVLTIKSHICNEEYSF